MPVIRTDEDYRKALAEIERLIDHRPAAHTSEAEKLEILDRKSVV